MKGRTTWGTIASLKDTLKSNNEAIADSQRLTEMIREYMEAGDDNKKANILGDMVLSQLCGFTTSK